MGVNPCAEQQRFYHELKAVPAGRQGARSWWISATDRAFAENLTAARANQYFHM